MTTVALILSSQSILHFFIKKPEKPEKPVPDYDLTAIFWHRFSIGLKLNLCSLCCQKFQLNQNQAAQPES